MLYHYQRSDYYPVIHVSCYGEPERISHSGPSLVNRGNLRPVDLHLIVVFREVSMDAEKFDAVSFHPVLFPYQLDNLLLDGAQFLSSIVMDCELASK